MYLQGSSLNPDVFFQGDILRDFPFLILDEEQIKPSSTSIEIRAKPSAVMLLSQTCDLQRRPNVILCPVFKIENNITKKDEVDSIRKRKTGYWFYLPEMQGVLAESFADFQTMYYAPRNFVEQHKRNKILSLSDWGRHHLSWALSSYFGRPIANKE